jgi:hypothetical protein
MNINKSLFFLACAAGLAAGLQASTVSAKDCQPSATDPAVASATGFSCVSTTAHAFGKANVSSGSIASGDTWTYRLNFVAGPTFPTRSSSLINADGVTFTVNKLSTSGGRCPPALDTTSPIDGNFGPAQVCVTQHAGQTGAPKFYRISIPGN